ncbi:MAG: primosomal protein N' [Chloroflexi bacterium]|nr:primosomal protein N' [Chloroflexota bacterium]
MHAEGYVEVAVDAGPVLPRRMGAGVPGLYTYHTLAEPPPVGSLVLVPFGPRERAAVIVGPAPASPTFATRPVGAIIPGAPRLSAASIALARWMSGTYRDPLFECLSLMLPPGARKQLERAVSEGIWPEHRPRKRGRDAVTADEPRPEPRPAPALTADQASARDRIVQAAMAGAGGSFLLYGVTGSGKTLVYLEAAARVAAAQRQVIILVPEIALTPALVERFRQRFQEQLAVLHSRLTPSQRASEWQRIAAGQARVVIGARSGIFAPVQRLGLVVLDEEHEWSYKQDDSPRFHARDVALQLGKLAGAAVVLASATPDVCTTWLAEQGVHRTLHLRARYGAETSGEVRRLPLPTIEIVDLRAELREGRTGSLSRLLIQRLEETLGRGEQAILFINRRGTATCVTCRSCGHVAQCRRCNVPLVYHRGADRLICHHCNRRRAPIEVCPSCGSEAIRYLGAGTQQVVDELGERFPEARVLRIDRDAASAAHVREGLRQIAEREIDVLVGTQMIAKSFDFPHVTLVGVVLADVGLFLPDFRAGERSFQLLTQVAGRAGRASRPGHVVVQTYVPDHDVLRLAADYNYRGFYRREIRFRREHGYPPFGRIVRFILSGSNEQRNWQETQRLRRELRARTATLGRPDIRLLGPAPCYFERLRGRWRWQLLALGDSLEALLDDLVLPPGWVLDVDPMDLL